MEALLGEGGLSQVFRVRHVSLGTTHAVKILTMTHQNLVDRLLQEGRIQAQLHHPNIVSVSDVVMHQGSPGLLMEFVDCETLEAALARRGAYPLDEALDMFAQVLSGVATAHAAGVLHRDLKPANILLARTPDGPVPKVSDFGIAKLAETAGGAQLTRAGVTMGTPGYMAPEQSEDAGNVDLRADIFSLGAILYELVTGQRAFPSKSVRDTLNASAAGRYTPPEVLRPDCPSDVALCIKRAMQPMPEDRFADCRAFALALYADRPELLARVDIGRVTPAPLPAHLWPRGEKPADAPSGARPTPVGITIPDDELESMGPPSEETLDADNAPSRVHTMFKERAPAMVVGLAALCLFLIGLLGGLWYLMRTDLHNRENPGDAPAATPDAATAEPAPSASETLGPGVAPVGEAPANDTTPPVTAPAATTPAATTSSASSATTPASPPRATTPAPAESSATVTPPTESPAAATAEGPAATPAEPAAPAEAPPASTDPDASTPAVAEAAVAADPAPEEEQTAPAIPSLVGVWMGEPWTVTLLQQQDGAVEGYIYRGSGGERLPVTGTFDANTLTLVLRDTSPARFVLTGKMAGNKFFGTYTQGTGEIHSKWWVRKAK